MWFLRNIISSAVYALLVSGGGILIAYLKRKQSEWASPVLYGVGGAAAIAVLIFAVKSFVAIPPKPTEITTNNISTAVSSWLDDFNLSHAKLTNPDAYWGNRVNLADGDSIFLFRSRAKDKYLTIQALVILSPEDQQKMAKLSKAQVIKIGESVEKEMLRAKIAFLMNLNPFRLGLIYLEPITSDLSEATVMHDIDQLDDAALLAKLALHEEIQGTPPFTLPK